MARATIYRNWPEPADLIEIMLQRATALPERTHTPTGNLRTDLHEAMDTLLYRFDHKPVRPFFAACLEYGRRSDRVAGAARAFTNGILEPFRMVRSSALAAERIDGDVDDLLHELAGPPIVRHVILGEPLSSADGHAIVDRFVDRHTD